MWEMSAIFLVVLEIVKHAEMKKETKQREAPNERSEIAVHRSIGSRDCVCEKLVGEVEAQNQHSVRHNRKAIFHILFPPMRQAVGLNVCRRRTITR